MGAQDERAPGWYELPFKRLLKYVVETAIIFFLVGWIATRLVNWDYLLLQIHMQNLWLIIPEGVIALGTFYLWRWSRISEKKKRQKQAKQRLQTLLREAGGEQKK